MMTSAQYRQSLLDGRQVFVDGHTVTDVTTDPYTSLAVDWFARGYDRFYDPGEGATGPYFFVPRSSSELREAEERRKTWDFSQLSTSTGLLMLLTVADHMEGSHPAYAKRIRRFFDEARRADVRCVLGITDAKGDRSKSPAEQDDPDSYVHVVERRDDGIVISGAKMHVSSTVAAHEVIVIPTKRMKDGEADYAVACAVPVNDPGVKVIATTFGPRPDFDPRKYPYSWRHTSTEAMVVFDEVFVPTERVFLAGEVEYSALFAHSLGLWERLSIVSRYVDISDTLVGLAQMITEANGLHRVGHIRDKIDEMIISATMIRAAYEAAMANATVTEQGVAAPDELFTNAGKYYSAFHFTTMIRHLHDIAGGAALTAPSLADLENPATAEYVDKYMRAQKSYTAEERMRLFHAIRDYTADAYGGWQMISTLQGGGGLYAQQVVARKYYDMDRAKRLARRAADLPDPA